MNGEFGAENQGKPGLTAGGREIIVGYLGGWLAGRVGDKAHGR